MEQRCSAKRRMAACALSLALAISAVTPAFAAGNDSVTLSNNAAALATRVEETTRAYHDAEAALASINEQIAQNEEKKADIEARLPEQRARTAKSVKELYILQQSTPNLIDLILSAENFNDFITTAHYFDTITKRNTEEVRALSDLHNELVQTSTDLIAQRDEAEVRQEDARTALEDARSVRVAVQQNVEEIAKLEGEDRAKAIQAAAQAIEAAASGNPTNGNGTATNPAPAANTPNTPNDANGSTTQPTPTATPEQPNATEQQPAQQTAAEEPKPATMTTVSGNTAVVQVPAETSPSTDPIVTNTTSEEVSSWADRINTYLEGTALAGYGEAFAQAASDYGVDPRIAPAISGVESGWGQVCFRDHNAWGWGSSDWDSWETAIDSYVSGYSNIYGSSITLEGAEMYASNDIYDEWYSTVLSEMDRI